MSAGVEVAAAPVLSYRSALMLLGTATWLGPFTLDAYAPAFPAIAHGYDVSDGLVQLTLSASLVGFAVGPIVAGGLSDRHGRRTTLLVTLVLYALTCLGCAAAPTIWSLVGIRFVQGMLAALILTTARAAARDIFDGVQLTRFYIHLAGLTAVAPLVGPLMGAQVVRVAGWQWIFVVIAAATLVLTTVIALLLPETLAARHPGAQPPATMGRLLGDRAFVLVAVTLGLAVGVGLSYVASSPFVLQDGYGLSPQQYSLLFCGNAVILIVVGQVNARLAKRHASEKVLPYGLTGQVVATVVAAVCLFAHAPVVLTCAALYLMIVTHGLAVPHLVSVGMQRAKHAPGAASSVLGIAQFSIGAILVPALTLGGLSPAASLGTAMPVLAVLALLTYRRSTRAGWRNQPLTHVDDLRHTSAI